MPIRNTSTGEIVPARKIPFTPGWRVGILPPRISIMGSFWSSEIYYNAKPNGWAGSLAETYYTRASYPPIWTPDENIPESWADADVTDAVFYNYTTPAFVRPGKLYTHRGGSFPPLLDFTRIETGYDNLLLNNFDPNTYWYPKKWRAYSFSIAISRSPNTTPLWARSSFSYSSTSSYANLVLWQRPSPFTNVLRESCLFQSAFTVNGWTGNQTLTVLPEFPNDNNYDIWIRLYPTKDYGPAPPGMIPIFNATSDGQINNIGLAVETANFQNALTPSNNPLCASAARINLLEVGFPRNIIRFFPNAITLSMFTRRDMFSFDGGQSETLGRIEDIHTVI